MSSCLFQRHFSNRFLYCISYILLFYTSNKYSHKMLICNFFFNFTQWFQALAKGLIMFIYMLYCFLLSKSKMQATKKSCLPGFLSWGTLKPHFLRFETKLLQIFFFLLLFTELHITCQLYQGFLKTVKLPFCVTTSFTRTTICFSTQRSLVKILQRKLIGKTYNTSSLSNIIGERGVALQKIQDNIVRSSPVSPASKADSLQLSHWGSPLKEKEEKICFHKVGICPGIC